MTIIKSLKIIKNEEDIKRLSYDFNIEEFCKENAIGIGIITPFEVILIGAKLLSGIHHDMILDKVVQIIGESHFKTAIVVIWYSLPKHPYHDIRFEAFSHGTVKTKVITKSMEEIAVELKKTIEMIRDNNKNEIDLHYGNHISKAISGNEIKVVDDKDVIGKDKPITFYGVRLESFRDTLKTLEGKLKGNKQCQYTQ